jgi:hypothetical protein
MCTGQYRVLTKLVTTKNSKVPKINLSINDNFVFFKDPILSPTSSLIRFFRNKTRGIENIKSNKNSFKRLNRSPKRLEANISKVKIPIPRGKERPRVLKVFCLGKIRSTRGSPIPKVTSNTNIIEIIIRLNFYHTIHILFIFRIINCIFPRFDNV